LDRSFKFLRAVGLIAPEVIDVHHFAHTSVLLMEMKALGLTGPELLVPYITNPGAFLASAIAAGLPLHADVKRQVRMDLEDALWRVAEGGRSGSDVPLEVDDAVAFTGEVGREFLERLAEKQANLASRIRALATDLRSRTISGVVGRSKDRRSTEQLLKRHDVGGGWVDGDVLGGISQPRNKQALKGARH